MPPRASTGETIEQLVGDDGIYHTTLTLGHDADARSARPPFFCACQSAPLCGASPVDAMAHSTPVVAAGAWKLTLDVREPVIIHHVAFDVGNEPKNPDFFKTDFKAPFEAIMPSGVLRDGDKLRIVKRVAVRLGGVGPVGAHDACVAPGWPRPRRGA